MKKVGLLPKLVIGIVFGIIIGAISKATEAYFISRIFVTFSTIFGSFLSFIIPCIIIGFVAKVKRTVDNCNVFVYNSTIRLEVSNGTNT